MYNEDSQTQLDASAIEAVRKLTIDSLQPTLLNIGQSPDTAIIFNPARGVIEQCVIPPAARNYELHSIESFCKAATHFNTIADDADKSGAVVFVGVDECHCILRESDKRNGRLFFAMRHTPAWQSLKLWSYRPDIAGKSQREFVEVLRTYFSDGVDPANLLNRIRTLKITKAESGEATIKVGTESFNRTLEHSIVGDGEAFPDYVTVQVRIYENVTLAPVSVKCALGINLADSRISMVPLPGVIADLELAARSAITKRVIDGIKESGGSENIPVFDGDPAFKVFDVAETQLGRCRSL